MTEKSVSGWAIALAAFVISSSAVAVCLNGDQVSLILDAKARGESLSSIKSGFFPRADGATLATVNQVFASGVKPWNAPDYAIKLCTRPETSADPRDPRNMQGFSRLPPDVQASQIRKYEASKGAIVPNPKCPYGARQYGAVYECVRSPEEEAQAKAQLEKQKEAAYNDSFHRMPNIPGICVGEDCNHIRKIQRWDSNGNMLN